MREPDLVLDILAALLAPADPGAPASVITAADFMHAAGSMTPGPRWFCPAVPAEP